MIPELPPRVGQKQRGQHDVATGQARSGADLGRISPQIHFGEPLLQSLRAERREGDDLAPRADGFEQGRRLGGDEDDVGERCRLLERLQESVLALLGHSVRLLDDEDAVLALERPVRRRLDDPRPYLIHEMLRAWRAEPREVGMGRRVGGHTAAGGLRVRGPECEELAGKCPGGSSLA